MANQTITRLLTDKVNVGTTTIDVLNDDKALGDGEILVKVDQFGLSSNNITYAALGDFMNYWKFFPTGQDGWGHMPVWGFADVVASNVDGIAVGERFYGYFPVATRFRMAPIRVTERGFYDGAEHRLELVSAYNFYTRCSTDAGYSPDMEEYQMLFRPLFITSFMLADYLEDNDCFGAKRLLVSSASSKTAYGTAYCLEGRDDLEVIALTSAKNKSFVEKLGCYDTVISYEELDTLERETPITYVDFSGDYDLRTRIHDYFGPSLVFDCFAGTAANTGERQEVNVSGPRPVFFFAPNQIKKRNADWTPQGFNERYGAAEKSFYARVSDAANPWMTLSRHEGMEALQGLIADLYETGGKPIEGMVVRL